jgi:hypothetical protein
VMRRSMKKTPTDAGGALPPERESEALAASAAIDAQVSASNLSLHELFEQQAGAMLDRADIDEEQKQSILLAMVCPCCGSGGLSFSVKLRQS